MDAKVHGYAMFMSHVGIQLQAPKDLHDEVLRRWAGCAAPLVPTTVVVQLKVTSSADATVRIEWVGTGREAKTVPAALALSEIERAIYGSLRPWHQASGTHLMHAAWVVKEGVGLLLVGPSGAGKSSMTLAAVRRGWVYGSDDIVVTDGDAIWGVARPLQFDPVPPEQPFIARLADLERLLYTVHLEDGEVVQPGWILSGDAVVQSPHPLRDVHVVTISQGPTDAVRRHLPGETTAALIGASYDWPDGAIGWPSCLGQGFALQWAAPQPALALLEELLFP